MNADDLSLMLVVWTTGPKKTGPSNFRFGEQRRVKAYIKEMNLVDHRILLVED